MNSPFKTLVAAILSSLLLLGGNAFSAEPTALEVVVSKPKAGVNLDDLLAADKKMEEQFVAKQPGFKTRQIAVNKDGEVFAIVHWATLKDAEAAGAAFMTNPSAKIRNDKSELISFKHYVKRD